MPSRGHVHLSGPTNFMTSKLEPRPMPIAISRLVARPGALGPALGRGDPDAGLGAQGVRRARGQESEECDLL